MRTALALLGAFVVLAFVFTLWPGLDVGTSALFYDVEAGFWVNAIPSLSVLREIIWNTILLVFAAATLLWIWTAIRGPVAGISARVFGFVSTLYLLGPGLLVNGILKQYWGRARPANTVEFGGEALFTPALEITDQCASNCSFVSGEGAGAAALAISVWVLSGYISNPVWRWAVRGVALIAASFGVAMRVMKGRHFLSDSLFAVLFMLVLAVVLARLFRLPPSPANHAERR